MDFKFPGVLEKLLHQSYGVEEYLVVALCFFVVFVAIKHLIFHTLYFWWYREGQFYIPRKCLNILTGKTLSQRILQHVSSMTAGSEKLSVTGLLSVLDDYFRTKEFAPSVGSIKGQIIDDIVNKCVPVPSAVLVVGCHVGYCVLRIVQHLPRTAVVLVIEPNQEFVILTKELLRITGLENKVIFLCTEPTKCVIEGIQTNYGIDHFDFVFLNRTKHNKPSHVSLLKLLEENSAMNNGYFRSYSTHIQDGKEVGGTVILADKVVALGDSQFLKYVRNSDRYKTKYYQMTLEHSPEEIVDGMEMAVFTG